MDIYIMLLVDAHVHIYACYNLKIFLNKTLINFQKASGASNIRFGKEGDDNAVLMLTENMYENQFDRLLRFSKSAAKTNEYLGNDWKVCSTKEPHSIYISYKESQGFFIISGQQIVTKENLEILSIGTTTKIEKGLPVHAVLKKVNELESLAVMPWGPGKWVGHRGKIVRNVIQKDSSSIFFLGDNGNRPAFWPRPSLFRLAEAKGIWDLPGSDPLPFTSEQGRAGSYGFLLDCSIDPDYPSHDLLSILFDSKTNPQTYGKRECPQNFFRNQIAMQWKKHRQ